MVRHHKLIALLVLLLAACHKTGPIANCHPNSGPCTNQSLSTTLEIAPTPVRAMRELTFLVSADTKSDRLTLDLSMPGMTMGPNQVTLTKDPDGAFAGKGVIVRCPSGGTLWRAAVYDGDILMAEYTFDVKD